MEIAKMLVLSTAHLRPATCNSYLAHHRTGAYAKGDYGTFLYVSPEAADESDDSDNEDPIDLRLVLAFARGAGCDWIMIDCDGPQIDGLPTYDWKDA